MEVKIAENTEMDKISIKIRKTFISGCGGVSLNIRKKNFNFKTSMGYTGRPYLKEKSLRTH